MRQRLKSNHENVADRLSYKVQVPKKKIISERKKIRQLLRSMLPMEEEQRQLKEEQSLFR